MDICKRFLDYANAFELTLKDNDWSRMDEYFTEGATYDNGMGQVAKGRAAVMAAMQGSVDGLDRQVDNRDLQLAAPSAEGDTVLAGWMVHYSVAGLPDLKFSGQERARFEGDSICELRSEFDPGALEVVGDWMAKHGGSLNS